jgi:hypothetical protein
VQVGTLANVAIPRLEIANHCGQRRGGVPSTMAAWGFCVCVNSHLRAPMGSFDGERPLCGVTGAEQQEDEVK